MAGLFIDVRVQPELVDDRQLAARLTEVCPVDIFAQDAGGRLRVVQEHLDECVLCELCLSAAPPGSLTVVKLYSGEALTR